MSIATVKDNLADFAKDIKLNLSSVLTPEGAPDLTQSQIAMIALSSAYATKNEGLISAMQSEAAAHLSDEMVTAAKAATTIMAMNNIYYRFVHLSSDPAFGKMPAKLRMNVIANPGVDKNDFELASLAVSALNGCGMCMDAHSQALQKGGVSQQAIQSAIRIASVVNAAAMAMSIG